MASSFFYVTSALQWGVCFFPPSKFRYIYCIDCYIFGVSVAVESALSCYYLFSKAQNRVHYPRAHLPIQIEKLPLDFKLYEDPTLVSFMDSLS
jgi:hypothetical protein